MKDKKAEKIFVKDPDNLEILKNSLKSDEIDRDIIPVLKKFFDLPLTPYESCYGHVKMTVEPYISFIEDNPINYWSKKFQNQFKKNLYQLNSNINQRLGNDAVLINLFQEKNGKIPKDYTLSFEIKNKKIFNKFKNKFFEIIWHEFCKYLEQSK